MDKFDVIKQSVINKGYKFFDSGNFNLNIIFVREDNKITNYFTDKLYVLYYIAGNKQIFECNATTKPGIKGSIDSPITYDGVTGTAIIKPNQYRSSFQFIDSYNEFSKYPYLKQIKPLNYLRDGDKDYNIDDEIDSDGDSYIAKGQDNKIFGTHVHRMSNNGATGFPINNWSLGCIGAEEPYFRIFVGLVRKSAKFYGDKFTVTILERKDIVNE